jgi:hypothetical protein
MTPLAELVGLVPRHDYGCPNGEGWAQPTERQLLDWIIARGWLMRIAVNPNDSRVLAWRDTGPRSVVEFCAKGRDGTCFDVLEQLVRHIAGTET